MSKKEYQKKGKVIALKYANFLRKNKFPFSSMYLYGSYAKGTPHQDSDVDILVISKLFSKSKWNNHTNQLWRSTIKVDSRIEPYAMSPQEFRGLSPLAHEVKKHGVKIA